MVNAEDVSRADMRSVCAGPAIITAAVIREPNLGKQSLHRASGFTRRFQRATGLLADERHEIWETDRLQENLLIESIRREVPPFEQSQPAAAIISGVANQQVQSKPTEFREQKSTTGTAMAMASRDQHRNRNEAINAGGARPVELPVLQTKRVALRTSERAAQREQRLREIFADDYDMPPRGGGGGDHLSTPDVLGGSAADMLLHSISHVPANRADTSGMGVGAGVRSATSSHRRPGTLHSPQTGSKAGGEGKKSTREQYATWGWSQTTAPSVPLSSPKNLRAGALSAMGMIENYTPFIHSLFPGHPCSPPRDDQLELGFQGGRTAGSFTRKVLPASTNIRDHVQQHSVPNMRQDASILKFATGVSGPRPKMGVGSKIPTTASTR